MNLKTCKLVGFAPIVGFFDLESKIEPVAENRTNTQKTVTRAIEEHKPCSYVLLFVALNEVEPYFFDIKSGPNVMSEFVKSLERIAKQIYEVKQKHRNFEGEPTIPKVEATHCWICESELDQSPQKPTGCWIFATSLESILGGHILSAI